MEQREAKRRIDELSHLLDSYNYSYYTLDKAIIDDFQYDALMRELLDLERDFPNFKVLFSPSQRIPKKITSSLEKITHGKRMLSLENTYNKEELREWYERIIKNLPNRDLQLTAELKIDGVSCSLTYMNGVLNAAATRGDGIEGEDVSNNVRTIRQIPLRLRLPNSHGAIEIRGEVYISRKDFELLNECRKKKEEPILANPRNLASGTLKLLDSNLAKERHLRFFVHSIGHMDNVTFLNTQWDFLEKMKEWGFPVNSHRKLCSGFNEIMSFCEHWATSRNELDYDIDGVVIKVNDFNLQEMLGETVKSPRWAVAYKFPAYKAETIINNILVQVGRSGVLTPVAELEPVACAGVVISRATLHNFDEIERLGVNIGDKVLIERAGDVIPKIIKVISQSPGGEGFNIPEFCPSCGGKIIREKDKEVAYRCVNVSCPQQIERGLIHFASRNAMDIKGLGEAAVVQLLDKGLIKSLADIYYLRKEDLIGLELFAEKKAEKLIAAIEESKKKPLARFLLGLGIMNIGIKAASVLAKKFCTVKALSDASIEELQSIDDVGPIMAKSVVDFFRASRIDALLQQFRNAGVDPVEELVKNVSMRLQSKRFVFTGKLDGMSREDAGKLVEAQGGKVSGSVSKATDYVVVGSSPSSKQEQARKLGVIVLNQKQFEEMLNGQTVT